MIRLNISISFCPFSLSPILYFLLIHVEDLLVVAHHSGGKYISTI